MKIALVHDHLWHLGGAENVLRELADLFPQAPIFTSVYSVEGTEHRFADRQVIESWVAKWPLARKKTRWYLPLMAPAMESFNFSGYDVVISDASAFAKGIIVPPGTLHICYCYTPTRYLWSSHDEVIDTLEKFKPVGKLSEIYRSKLRLWDRMAADRPDKMVAISKYITKRIKKYYQRESEVIYPPVDTSKFKIADQPDKFFLLISRLRPYKKADIVVQAFNKINIPLKVIGVGEEEKGAKKLANPNVEFLGWLSDEERNSYLSRCQALIHPQEEDFGLTMVEAMASGRPVIAYKAGGALEVVEEGVTGRFFEEQTWEALADTIIRFREDKWDSRLIQEKAKRFDSERFRREFKEMVEKTWYEFKQEGLDI